MPRQASLDVPGALHHIMVRGINKSIIFTDDQDRNLFLIHPQSGQAGVIPAFSHDYLMKNGKPGDPYTEGE